MLIVPWFSVCLQVLVLFFFLLSPSMFSIIISDMRNEVLFHISSPRGYEEKILQYPPKKVNFLPYTTVL